MAQGNDLWFTRELITNCATEALSKVAHNTNASEWSAGQALNLGLNRDKSDFIATSNGDEAVTPQCLPQSTAMYPLHTSRFADHNQS
jgi:hypothetical protein